MNRAFHILLIAIFILPVFGHFVPQNIAHALHDHSKSHHHPQDHHEGDTIGSLGDYLHIELQSPERVTLKSPVLEILDSDFSFKEILSDQASGSVSMAQAREPPNRRRQDNTPLYLSTQRLRI